MAEKIDKHIVVCTPLYESVPAPSFRSFINVMGSMSQVFEGASFSTSRSTLVHIARRKIAEEVMKLDEERPVDFLLWIDSDSVFSMENVLQLFYTQQKINADLASGLYVTKRDPIQTVCYTETLSGYASLTNIQENTIFQVDGVGFGFLLMKMDALKKVVDKYGVEKAFHVVDPFNGKDLGEDLVFCRAAKKEGLKIFVNSGIQIGHAGSVIMPKDFIVQKKNIEKAQTNRK